MTFSEFPTEADLEDFTEATADRADEEEEGEEVVEDRDFSLTPSREMTTMRRAPPSPAATGPPRRREIS